MNARSSREQVLYSGLRFAGFLVQVWPSQLTETIVEQRYRNIQESRIEIFGGCAGLCVIAWLRATCRRGAPQVEKVEIRSIGPSMSISVYHRLRRKLSEC